MKTYYVLTHAEKESKAIKDGFSWPAFFFPIPWALVKGLFGVAFMLFLTWVVLFSISYGIMVIAPEASSWLSLIFLLAKIVAGNLANDWLKEKLCESGYVLERKVEAKQPSQAIAALSNHPTIWIDPTIPLLGSKKESNSEENELEVDPTIESLVYMKESTQTSLIGGSPDAGGGKKSPGMIRILVGTAVLVLCVFGLNAAFKHYDRERTIREGQEIEYTLRIAWNERDVELAKSALQNDAWRYIPSGPPALSDLLALSIYENEIAFVDLLTSFIGNLDTRSVWSSVIRDFDTRMYGKMPPLHQAAYLGRPRIVELLLERGADAEKHWGEDEDSLTPFEFSLLPSRDEAADLEGKKQAAGILRDWIAPPNSPSLQQQSSTDSGKSEDSPSLLNQELADQSLNAKLEADIESSDASAKSPMEAFEHEMLQLSEADMKLFDTRFSGDLRAAEHAIRDGANVNMTTLGRPIIFSFIKAGLTDFVELLIKNGANLEKRTLYGRTPLFEAAVYGQVDIARLLLENGANVNARNSREQTPLDYTTIDFSLWSNGPKRSPERDGVAELLRRHGGLTGVEATLLEAEEKNNDGFSSLAESDAKTDPADPTTHRLAAEQGEAEAQLLLGDCYKTGAGVPQDYKEAVKWYRLAAEQENSSAQNNLGYSYHYGEGVPQDYVEAVKWYRLAADQGYAEAQNNLGVCYENGEGVPQDYAEAVRWFRLAAEQGILNAQTQLGYYYHGGLGVSQDYAEAVKWVSLAADQGYAEAQNNLGWCYENGVGVPKDYAEAVKWYRLAADQGNSNAQNNLGLCYDRNQGVPRDDVLAYMWFNLAGASGSETGYNNRESISKRMTPEQIAEAQKLSREWKPKG